MCLVLCLLKLLLCILTLTLTLTLSFFLSLPPLATNLIQQIIHSQLNNRLCTQSKSKFHHWPNWNSISLNTLFSFFMVGYTFKHPASNIGFIISLYIYGVTYDTSHDNAVDGHLTTFSLITYPPFTLFVQRLRKSPSELEKTQIVFPFSKTLAMTLSRTC